MSEHKRRFASLADRVMVRAQEGHKPAWDLVLAWGRIIQERKDAWERAKRQQKQKGKAA